MTLKPTDMLEIQSAIDAYERKFPRRPAPSAEVALAWRLGKREWARRQAAQKAAGATDPNRAPNRREKPDSALENQECNRLVWAWQQFRLRWLTSDDVPTSIEGSLPWTEKALLVGWWGVFAVLVASIFFLGAMVGGFK
jgi:hypothetical protein